MLQILHSLLTLDSDDNKKEVEEEEDDDDKWDIYVTGHSLGGALATLCAFDIGNAINTPYQPILLIPDLRPYHTVLLTCTLSQLPSQLLAL